jgi:hypothetical protein
MSCLWYEKKIKTVNMSWSLFVFSERWLFLLLILVELLTITVDHHCWPSLLTITVDTFFRREVIVCFVDISRNQYQQKEQSPLTEHKKGPRHVTLEIKVLAWNKKKDVTHKDIIKYYVIYHCIQKYNFWWGNPGV